ncbi:hypothetical protein ACWD0J_04285 [Streptomyces sp. NPDC003011]
MNAGHDPARTGPGRLTTAVEWAVGRRRTALTHMLRGACYGMGTGAIGLVYMWVERCL